MKNKHPYLQPLSGVRLEEGPGPVLALEAQALQGGRGHLGLSALHREEELPASLHPGTQLQELCVEQTLSTTIFLRIASSSSQGSSCCPPPPLRLVAGRLVFFFKVFSDSLPLQPREEPVRSQLSSLSSESLLLDSVFFRAEKKQSRRITILPQEVQPSTLVPGQKKLGSLLYIG